MNINNCSLVTQLQLQVMVCVFHVNYAFHLIVKGLMVCTFSRGFCTNCRFAVTRL